MFIVAWEFYGALIQYLCAKQLINLARFANSFFFLFGSLFIYLFYTADDSNERNLCKLL